MSGQCLQESKDFSSVHCERVSCFPFDNLIFVFLFFSSPGRSLGRAIVLPPASVWAAAAALAKSLTLKFFMRWARRCQASYPVPVTGLVFFFEELTCSSTHCI